MLLTSGQKFLWCTYEWKEKGIVGTIDGPIISQGLLNITVNNALVNRAAGTPTGGRTSEI